jgi:aminoglycoside phosphotransferase family enzyme/predicted kinase
MDFSTLLDALSCPEAYSHPAAAIEVHQTHLSAVFLAGPWAYKIKKPVNLGFVDCRSLETRRHFCEEEVRLNRRLAPSVYRGVVPVVRTAPLPQGQRGERSGIRVGGDGEVVEWAVQMERLPESARLKEAVERGNADAEVMVRLARRIAHFHATACPSPRTTGPEHFDVVAENARENFRQTLAHRGLTVRPVVHERLRELTEEALARLRLLIQARAARGLVREIHGDLHLDHVYLFADRPEPDDLVIIDCIEFNERFRHADPVADMAFLVMDLLFKGRADLAHAFADAYFASSGDEEGRALLPLYTAYRAVVRAKVDGMTTADVEVPAQARDKALRRGRAHWLLALGQLEPPERRPCLILVGGLPGTGKSTLARDLAEQAHLTVLRSDVIRKELASHEEDILPGLEGEIYTPEWSERTYSECLDRARVALLEGGRLVVDATFYQDARREAFLEAARELCVPTVCLLCHADPATVRTRLQQRHGDASDANWEVYLQVANQWQEPGPITRPAIHFVFNDAPPHLALADALGILRFLRLMPSG